MIFNYRHGGVNKRDSKKGTIALQIYSKYVRYRTSYYYFSNEPTKIIWDIVCSENDEIVLLRFCCLYEKIFLSLSWFF